MGVLVRRGIVRAGRLIADGVSYRIRRAGQGEYLIQRMGPYDIGCVRYFAYRDHLILENPWGRIEIRFHPTGTSFAFDRRFHRIGSMLEGRIVIYERHRLVAKGRVTPSGVRLETLAPDLHPIQRELALGLALRSEDLSRQAAIAQGPG